LVGFFLGAHWVNQAEVKGGKVPHATHNFTFNDDEGKGEKTMEKNAASGAEGKMRQGDDLLGSFAFQGSYY